MPLQQAILEGKLKVVSQLIVSASSKRNEVILLMRHLAHRLKKANPSPSTIYDSSMGEITSKVAKRPDTVKLSSSKLIKRLKCPTCNRDCFAKCISLDCGQTYPNCLTVCTQCGRCQEPKPLWNDVPCGAYYGENIQDTRYLVLKENCKSCKTDCDMVCPECKLRRRGRYIPRGYPFLLALFLPKPGLTLCSKCGRCRSKDCNAYYGQNLGP
jgi:hypothetical protein